MGAATVVPAVEVPDTDTVPDSRAVDERRGRFRAVALMLTSATSNQVGAATGALGFPALGPAGVVAVRQWVAAVLMMSVVRPPLRSFTRREWLPVLGLAAIYATMNLTLYTAVDRIGLGLAVTLEFLGPLTVALAALRRRVDLFCAVAAGASVLVLMRPQPTTDYLGIALGLVAAACWAGYILLNRTLGRRLPSAQGAAASAAISALVYLPIGVWILVVQTPAAKYLAFAAVAGVLSSAVPYLVDLLTLRIVRPGFFGLFMSVHPLLAVLVGWLILGQRVGWIEWTAICAIVAANAISVATAQRSRP